MVIYSPGSQIALSRVDTSGKGLYEWNGLDPMRLNNKILRFVLNTDGRNSQNEGYLIQNLKVKVNRTSISEVEAHKMHREDLTRTQVDQYVKRQLKFFQNFEKGSINFELSF